MSVSPKVTVTEAVGVFDGYVALHRTIKELGSHGFGRHQISVRGSESSVKQHFGTSSVKPEALEDNPDAPRSYLVSVEELGVAQGVLVGAGIYISAAIALMITDGLATLESIIAVVIASIFGGIVGVCLAYILGIQYRKFFDKQARAGGLVLWVETPDDETVRKAQAILEKNGAHDIHIHDIAIAT